MIRGRRVSLLIATDQTPDVLAGIAVPTTSDLVARLDEGAGSTVGSRTRRISNPICTFVPAVRDCHSPTGYEGRPRKEKRFNLAGIPH